MALKNDGSIPNEMRGKAAYTNGKMKRKAYEKELHKLQVELCRLQDWVKKTGERIIILFEGRDAAGKGRDDQGYHRAGEPARLSRGCTACPFGPRKDPDVHAALH
jgi:polyphosphate kinase 2 (PPK2 family)